MVVFTLFMILDGLKMTMTETRCFIVTNTNNNKNFDCKQVFPYYRTNATFSNIKLRQYVYKSINTYVNSFTSHKLS